MNWESLRLQHLAYLDAAARLGHFGDAAAELDVSQPALSQGLARLEVLVGADLFESRGRRRVLTPAGTMLAEYADHVLSRTRAVAATLEARRRGKAGPLTIGMIDAAALYLLGDQLADFRTAHPEVELRLTVDTSSRLLQRLEAGNLDVAFVIAPAPGFATTHVMDEELHVYAAGHRPPADASSHDRWVLYPATSHTRAVIDTAFERRGIRPTVEAESGNPSVLAQLARLGVGATVLPAGIGESGRDPLARVGEPIAIRTLVAARRQDTGPDRLVEAFLTALNTF